VGAFVSSDCQSEQPSTKVRSLKKGDNVIPVGTILIIVLILILIGVIPTWGHSRAWGYGPSGIVGVILVVVLILFLLGKI